MFGKHRNNNIIRRTTPLVGVPWLSDSAFEGQKLFREPIPALSSANRPGRRHGRLKLATQPWRPGLCCHRPCHRLLPQGLLCLRSVHAGLRGDGGRGLGRPGSIFEMEGADRPGCAPRRAQPKVERAVMPPDHRLKLAFELEALDPKVEDQGVSPQRLRFQVWASKG